MTKGSHLPLQIVLYEDELADNGVSLLTVKVVNLKLLANVFNNSGSTLHI